MRPSVRPADGRSEVADWPALLDDSEEERAVIGENFCQPPLLLISRAEVELPELPGRGADPEFKLPRASEPLSEFALECWNPPLELAFELAFPDRATSRLFSIHLPFDADDVALRAEKKCWFCDTFRVVDAAAARPLAEKLSRLGLTGNLPVLKRAFWNCA